MKMDQSHQGKLVITTYYVGFNGANQKNNSIQTKTSILESIEKKEVKSSKTTVEGRESLRKTDRPTRKFFNI